MAYVVDSAFLESVTASAGFVGTFGVASWRTHRAENGLHELLRDPGKVGRGAVKVVHIVRRKGRIVNAHAETAHLSKFVKIRKIDLQVICPGWSY